MKPLLLALMLLAIWGLTGCKEASFNFFPATDPRLTWQGRNWQDQNGRRYLTGSASSLTYHFFGSKSRIWLQNAAPQGEYNYISIIIDGERQPRQAIRFDTLTPLEIVPNKKSENHTVELYKETEAANGAILISGIEADSLLAPVHSQKKRIEFIGNSITVGMSADASQIACDAGTWYDQHNAYDAFGPRVARALDMDYMLTGFSGIGIYRNTRADSPVMRDIFPSAFLSPNPNSPRWDFSQFTPDVVSICLGTNDFSGGDGATPRAAFDPEKFIPAYVDFLRTVHGHYPDAQIVITNTPMLSGQNNITLLECLSRIKTEAERTIPDLKPLLIFSFSKTYMGGCLGHPSTAEHALMAEEFIDFLEGI
jgi:hypothetical protein